MSPVIAKNKCDVTQSKNECGNRGLINKFNFLSQTALIGYYYWIDELAGDKDNERAVCVNAPARHSTNTVG